MNRSAHELKGALNGIALNLEVLRSRIASGNMDQKALGAFADAAYQEFETATARTEAVMFLGRDQGAGQTDVALTLKQLATLLVPAAKAGGTSLTVEGYAVSAPTAASAPGIRLALAAGMLAYIKEENPPTLNPVTCTLIPGKEPVVHFSHQSASAPPGSLGPVVTQAIAADGIRVQESDGELTLVFPKYQ